MLQSPVFCFSVISVCANACVCASICSLCLFFISFILFVCLPNLEQFVFILLLIFDDYLSEKNLFSIMQKEQIQFHSISSYKIILCVNSYKNYSQAKSYPFSQTRNGVSKIVTQILGCCVSVLSSCSRLGIQYSRPLRHQHARTHKRRPMLTQFYKTPKTPQKFHKVISTKKFLFLSQRKILEAK